MYFVSKWFSRCSKAFPKRRVAALDGSGFILWATKPETGQGGPGNRTFWSDIPGGQPSWGSSCCISKLKRCDSLQITPRKEHNTNHCKNACTYVCRYVCMFVYISIYIYIYVCVLVCMCVCVYVCMCVCMCVCTVLQLDCRGFGVVREMLSLDGLWYLREIFRRCFDVCLADGDGLGYVSDVSGDRFEIGLFLYRSSLVRGHVLMTFSSSAVVCLLRLRWFIRFLTLCWLSVVLVIDFMFRVVSVVICWWVSYDVVF